MIPEDAIRQRSFEIWLQEGCPDGCDLMNWFRAKEELEGEHRRSVSDRGEWRYSVMPRPPISQPPRRIAPTRPSAG